MVEILTQKTESIISKNKKLPTTNKQKFWFVYLLECMDGSFYTGVTNDIDKRMKTHAEGKGSKYVRQKKFKCLLHSKECESRSDACKAECHIKTLQKYDKLDWFSSQSKVEKLTSRGT